MHRPVLWLDDKVALEACHQLVSADRFFAWLESRGYFFICEGRLVGWHAWGCL